MIDRLQELRTQAGLSFAGVASEDGLYQQRVEGQQKYEDRVEDQFDEQFIQEIKSVRNMIAALSLNNKKIEKIKNQYAKAIKSSQERQGSQQMNEILLQNAKHQKGMRDKLQHIAAQVKAAQKNKPDQPQTRMKRNFYLNLRQEVGDILQKQQLFEEDFKNTVKDKVTRQVRLIDKEADEEQMQMYIDNPQLAQQKLEEKIMGRASVTLKNAVSDIQDKFRDIQRLEASVEQCVRLFEELSALVFAQGEKIDSIEQNVLKCHDYIESAEGHLQKAKEHHQCSKKCLCVGVIVGLVILVIVVIVVLATN